MHIKKVPSIFKGALVGSRESMEITVFAPMYVYPLPCMFIILYFIYNFYLYLNY